MATQEERLATTIDGGTRAIEVEAPNGAGIAAFLAAAIGACALGVVVLLNETGLFIAPTLYGPAGGVSGRTALAVVVWLAAWAVLHFRWKEREVDARPVRIVATILIALSIVATFPPFWGVVT
jgi:hypothetical protein